MKKPTLQEWLIAWAIAPVVIFLSAVEWYWIFDIIFQM
jgi:hypothetical protein